MRRYVVMGALFALVILCILVLFPTRDAVPTPLVETARFGEATIQLEYAMTTATREKGLGDRVFLGVNDTMLFVFPKDDFYGFWMKDTLVPLDMFWLDDKGQVIFIKENAEPESYPDVFYPTSPAKYVLETNAGFAKEHGIHIGTFLELKKFPTVSS